MTAIQSILANNLKRLRVKNQLGQRECAEACGISLRYYQDLEAGNKWPSVEVIIGLAKGLKCRQIDLFTE